MDEKAFHQLSRGFTSNSFGIASPSENPWIQYFSVYFKFGYFSFCCPYYFKYDTSERKYKAGSFRIQKVVCGFVQLLSVLILITDFRIIRAQDLKKNPVLYIELASLALNSWYQLGVIYIFWFKLSLFERLLNEICTTSLARFSRGDVFKIKALSMFICIVSFVQAFVSFLYGVDEKEWVLAKFLAAMTRRGRYMLFMNPTSMMDGIESAVITILYFLASFYSQLMKNTADVVGLLAVLFFRHVLYDFLEGMKEDGFTTQMLQTSYDAFKSILMRLNLAVGYFVFFFFLGPVPYYAINIVTMLDASDVFLLASNLIYLLNYFTTIILSARVNTKAEEIKDWISAEERYTEIPPPKLDLILHDITEYELALSGYGFFYASSSLVGAIVSLILTYAILVVQFQAGGSSEDAVGNGNNTLASSLTEAAALLTNQTLFRLR